MNPSKPIEMYSVGLYTTRRVAGVDIEEYCLIKCEKRSPISRAIEINIYASPSHMCTNGDKRQARYQQRRAPLQGYGSGPPPLHTQSLPSRKYSSR